MESEPTRTSVHLPATSPDWVQYYKRAKELRRLGKGQHAQIKAETKRRRRRANLAIVGSAVLLIAMIAVFVAILGTEQGAPEAGSGRAPSGPADSRRG